MLERISKATKASNLAYSTSDSGYAEILLAVAYASKAGMGSLAVRLKYGNDAACYHPLLGALLKVHLGLPVSFREAIAKQALREYLMPQCTTCAGTGKVKSEMGTHKACSPCASTGIKRFTDSERMKQMGMDGSAAPRMAPMVDKLVSELSTAELDLARQARKRLASA